MTSTAVASTTVAGPAPALQLLGVDEAVASWGSTLEFTAALNYDSSTAMYLKVSFKRESDDAVVAFIKMFVGNSSSVELPVVLTLRENYLPLEQAPTAYVGSHPKNKLF